MKDKVISESKFLVPLIILYVTIGYSTVILLYKIVAIGHLYVSAATIIIPFWFVLSDLIAELYGYKISRLVIWATMGCEFILILIITLMIHLPSPPFWVLQNDYNTVFGDLPRVFLGSLAAIIIGAFLNIYLLTKWKILLNGRYFWIRSIGSSFIGETIFTIVAFFIEFYGIYSFPRICELLGISLLIKSLFLPVAAVPTAILANILKKAEGIDVYDKDTNFNPLKLSIKD